MKGLAHPPPTRHPDAPIAGSILLQRKVELTDWLKIACGRCPRASRLSVARLIAEHGPGMPMTLLLRVLAAGCPRLQAARAHDPCGAHCPQLPVWFMTGG